MRKPFPALYPQQYLWGWTSSCHTSSGNPLKEQTKMALFNINNREISYPKLLYHLDVLCDKLPRDWDVDPWYIINNHTEYPAYFAFHYREKQLQNFEVDHNYKKAIKFINTVSNSTFTTFRMQICPKCYDEQIHKYGEAYLIRYHQDSNVKYCFKHSVPLRTYKNALDFRYFYDVNCFSIDRDFEIRNINEMYSNHYIDIANIYKDISDGLLIDYDLNDIKASYCGMLETKGYKNGNIINLIRLSQDIKDFYSFDFLNQMACGFSNDLSESWLCKIFTAYNPVNLAKHLLVIRFLFSNISNLKNFDYMQINRNSNSDFIDTILTSTKAKNSLLKELHCSLNVAYKKSKQFGIEEVFLKKMTGYFDLENIDRCKKSIEEFALQCNGRISKEILFRSLSGEYKLVNAWDDDWLVNLIKIRSNNGVSI